MQRTLFSLILIVISFISARASVFGDIKGTVLDPQQRPIARAKITLASRSSSFSRTTVADGVGEFSFRAVLVGDIDVLPDGCGLCSDGAGEVLRRGVGVDCNVVGYALSDADFC